MQAAQEIQAGAQVASILLALAGVRTLDRYPMPARRCCLEATQGIKKERRTVPVCGSRRVPGSTRMAECGFSRE